MLGKKFKANSTEKYRTSEGMNEECHERKRSKSGRKG